MSFSCVQSNCCFECSYVFSFLGVVAGVAATGFDVVKDSCIESVFVSTCVGIAGAVVASISYCAVGSTAKYKVMKAACLVSAWLSIMATSLFIVSATKVYDCIDDAPAVIVNSTTVAPGNFVGDLIDDLSPIRKVLVLQIVAASALVVSTIVTCIGDCCASRSRNVNNYV